MLADQIVDHWNTLTSSPAGFVMATPSERLHGLTIKRQHVRDDSTMTMSTG